MKRPADRLLALLVVSVALTFSACGGSSRPSASQWESVWEGATGSVPAISELGDPPDRDICGHALGALRSLRPDLFPTPDLALEGVVEEWVTIAEDAMFECPPASHEVPNLVYAYEELARLEAEVDAVLAIDLNQD